MAVIINEFEVVVDPPATAASEPGADVNAEAEQCEPQLISPQDLHNIMRQQYERLSRICAD